MRKQRVILSVLSSTLILVVFWAAPLSVKANSVPVTNVALNATVNLNGAAFFENGWGGGWIVSKDTIIDEIFFGPGRQWDRGPVWWDSHDGQERYITLDLGGLFEIESFIIQADNNDRYKLYYWDITSENWIPVWHLLKIPGWGMYTRPNPEDDTERYVLPETIITNALRFEGDMADSDRYFSVSEIQAFGKPVAQATIDFDPNTLNLKSKGKWITVYIELPGYDILDIDMATIMLNEFVPVEPWPVGIGDYDGDFIPDLMVKFDRAAVQAILSAGDDVEITITGRFYNTMLFTGTDYIQVI